MNRFLLFCCTLSILVTMTSIYGTETLLTLDECIELALEKNTTLLQSRYSYHMAKKDLMVAGSRFLPSVSTGIGYNHSVSGPSSQFYVDPSTGIRIPEQPDERTSWISGANIDVSQSLFNGSNIFTFKKNISLKKGTAYDLEETKQNIILLVKEFYYNLLKSEKLLEVQDSTLKSSEESFKAATIRYEVGTAPKSDVLKAQYQLESDRLTFIEAQNNLAYARAALNHVLGFDVDYKIQVIDELEMPKIEINYEDALKSGLNEHPLLLKTFYDVKAAKDEIGISVSQFLPRISAYYSYSWRNKKFDQISQILDQDYNWNLGVQLSLPIFQGFSRVAEIGKSKLMLKWYEEVHNQTKRDLTLEIKQAYFDVEQAKKKIRVTQSASEAADEDLRLNKEKYRLGAGTILELINAQVSYAEAQSNQIQALYDYKYAIARLQKAMGMLTR